MLLKIESHGVRFDIITASALHTSQRKRLHCTLWKFEKCFLKNSNDAASVCVMSCRRSTYNHLSSWLTDARNLTNPNTVSVRHNVFRVMVPAMFVFSTENKCNEHIEIQ